MPRSGNPTSTRCYASRPSACESDRGRNGHASHVSCWFLCDQILRSAVRDRLALAGGQGVVFAEVLHAAGSIDGA